MRTMVSFGLFYGLMSWFHTLISISNISQQYAVSNINYNAHLLLTYLWTEYLP